MQQKLKALGIVAGLVLLTLWGARAGLDSWQRGLIFHGTTYMKETPEDKGLSYSELWIDVSASRNVEAGRINAWWIPANSNNAPAILFLHGNAGSISSNLKYAVFLHDAGFSVFAFDYRGYGKSTALLPSEESAYADAQAAWGRFAELSSGAGSRLIYGHSLGGAIGIDLASKVSGVDGLIVEGSFTSALAEARMMFPNWWPLSLLVTQHFESDEKVRTLKMPKLFVHCTNDEVIPGSMSEELYRISPRPKTELAIPGGQHFLCPSYALDIWTAAVQKLASHAGDAAPP